MKRLVVLACIGVAAAVTTVSWLFAQPISGIGGGIGNSAANALHSLQPIIVATNEFARTAANATAYAANDVIAPSETATNLPLALTVAAANGGSGYITSCRVVLSTNNCTALLNLWLFTTTNITIQADNGPLTNKWVDRYMTLGPIPVQMSAGNDCSIGANNDIRLPFVCAANDTRLYFFLQTMNAWTPIGGCTNTIKLKIDPR